MTFDLTNYNSLRLRSSCENLLEIDSPTAVQDQVSHHALTRLKALGSGSNVILMPTLDQTILRSSNKTISLISEDQDSVLIRAGAGQNWHEFVLQCIEEGWYGLENLALIPGTVGAAPVQNIGAYGVEVMDCIHRVHGFDLTTFKVGAYNAAQCGFSYRNSRFKHANNRDFFITSVDFKLSKVYQPQIQYGALKAIFTANPCPSATEVATAICEIRQRKLPDPNTLPNVGSFFHNPIIDAQTLQSLKTEFPGIVHYPTTNGHYKLAAGWLIDQAQWRGYRADGVGVHKDQALVLVNYDASEAYPLLHLATRIFVDIKTRYGIELQREPELIGSN